MSNATTTSCFFVSRKEALNEALQTCTQADYASLLRSCSINRALSDGTHLHDHIVQHGLEQDKLLGRLLIQMYAKCAALEDAHSWLDNMCGHENLSSWNFMLGAYV